MELCRGEADEIWEESKGKVSFMWLDPHCLKNVKRIRLKCPECGRKVLSSVRVCGDGCHIIHTLPPHKPKGWWKRVRSRAARRDTGGRPGKGQRYLRRGNPSRI